MQQLSILVFFGKVAQTTLFYNLNVSSQEITNFALKSLWNKAPTDKERVLSTEAKAARGSRDRSHLFEGHRAACLVANTSHADNIFGREGSATLSHRENLFKNLHTV